MNYRHGITQCHRFAVTAFCVVMLGLAPSIAQAVDWWRTSEQQARDALEAGNIEQLQSVAPDANWQAIAKHENGEFEAAADDFSELAAQRLLEGDVQSANRALYNQGVSDVRAGNYESALDNFEQVLQSDPEFQDAAHNSEIVRQLIEQQEQQEQEQEQESGGEGEEGEEQSSDSDEQQPSDQQSSDDEQSDESQSEEGQNDEANEGAQDSENSEPSDAEQAASEEQQERDAQAARDALDAADQPPSDGQPAAGDEPTGEPVESAIETMSESDQAIEQWLRRIPDDPAGLLRRKLEQSHLTEFPEVTDAVKPW